MAESPHSLGTTMQLSQARSATELTQGESDILIFKTELRQKFGKKKNALTMHGFLTNSQGVQVQIIYQTWMGA